MGIVEKAILFAAKAHEGQVRKGTDIPYITHPYAVGMILMKYGCKEELVAAGLLHDTVEDTEVTIDEISEQFGEEAASIVAGCSEPDKSLSWEERKHQTIQYLRDASEEVRLVACADKLHNLRSIREAIEKEGESVWTRFNRGREKQNWYYWQVAASLGSQSSFPMLDELKGEIESLFGKEDHLEVVALAPVN